MTFVTLATSGLRNKPFRTIATAATVGIACASLVAILTIYAQLTVFTTFKAPNRFNVSSMSGYSMPQTHAMRIAKIHGVTGVEYQVLTMTDEPGQPPDSRPHFRLWGVTDNFATYYPHVLIEVPPEAQARWLSNRQGVLIDHLTAERAGLHEGSPIYFMNGNMKGVVSGIVNGHLRLAIAHIDFLKQNKAALADRVNRLIVDCDPTDCANFPERVDAEFDNDATGTFTVRLTDFFSDSTGTVGMLPMLFIYIGLLVLLVGVVTTAVTLAMSLRERRFEFGTLRALGFKRRQVFAVVLLEACAMCVIGGSIGIFATIVLARIFHPSMGSQTMTDLQVIPLHALYGLAAAALLGPLVSILPALTLLRQDIIRTMEA